MPTWFQSQLRSAVDMLHDCAAETVTYCRGQRSVSLTAIRDRQDFEQTEDNGTVTRITGYDWILKAEDLVLNGVQVEPCRDDVLTDENGFRYQVLPIGDEAVFHRQAGDTYSLRVHSRQVSS